MAEEESKGEKLILAGNVEEDASISDDAEVDNLDFAQETLEGGMRKSISTPLPPFMHKHKSQKLT